MSAHTGLVLILGFIAFLLLLIVLTIGAMIFVIYRYRVPMRGIAAMIGGLVYLISPVDVIPEAAFGPLGLVDDAGVLGAVAFFVYRLIQARAQQNDDQNGGPGPGATGSGKRQITGWPH